MRTLVVQHDRMHQLPRLRRAQIQDFGNGVVSVKRFYACAVVRRVAVFGFGLIVACLAQPPSSEITWVHALARVLHVAHALTDLSEALASVGDRNAACPMPNGRGDEFHYGPSTPEPRDTQKGLRIRDMYVRNLHLDSVKVKTRHFW